MLESRSIFPRISVAAGAGRKAVAMAAAPEGQRPNPWRFIQWRRENDDSKKGAAKQAKSGYKVAPGENLHDIATKHHTRVEMLMEANNILNPANIAPGEILWIPRTHEIVTGDTLYSLARKFGTEVAEIQAANGIENPDLIYIGDVILIPDNLKDE